MFIGVSFRVRLIHDRKVGITVLVGMPSSYFFGGTFGLFADLEFPKCSVVLHTLLRCARGRC